MINNLIINLNCNSTKEEKTIISHGKKYEIVAQLERDRTTIELFFKIVVGILVTILTFGIAYHLCSSIKDLFLRKENINILVPFPNNTRIHEIFFPISGKESNNNVNTLTNNEKKPIIKDPVPNSVNNSSSTVNPREELFNKPPLSYEAVIQKAESDFANHALRDKIIEKIKDSLDGYDYNNDLTSKKPEITLSNSFLKHILFSNLREEERTIYRATDGFFRSLPGIILMYEK